MASVNYMTQVLFSLGMVSNILNMAVRALASSARVEEVLKEKPAQELPERGAGPADIRGQVTFERVSFTYASTSRPAVEDVSFQAEAGETIGIIGPTGSGKSTLMDLVPRFYDATSGQVKIDGTDVREIDPGGCGGPSPWCRRRPFFFREAFWKICAGETRGRRRRT